MGGEWCTHTCVCVWVLPAAWAPCWRRERPWGSGRQQGRVVVSQRKRWSDSAFAWRQEKRGLGSAVCCLRLNTALWPRVGYQLPSTSVSCFVRWLSQAGLGEKWDKSVQHFHDACQVLLVISLTLEITTFIVADGRSIIKIRQALF